MLEENSYGCIGNHYFSIRAFEESTCCIERREAQDARMREYQHINQQEPPNIQMIPERQFSRLHTLDTITEDEKEESF